MEDNRVICEQCGWSWVVNLEKRNRTDLLCFSCRVKPAQVIQYGGLRCIPWSGDFADDLVTPVLNGVEFMPGERVCKHRDCVNPKHLA